ncbi:hypothetical protein GOP47_0015483 [Adiantum capillus-veneris]|uniref:Uncharacterized protein n=1 Tax=Adiantum capillus-veneris TaxID=13818 RepID=A0A9D4UK33_ADICA|nr:hypothetical protein GOP47_0015483 [Adiantum capillus-veneris]
MAPSKKGRAKVGKILTGGKLRGATREEDEQLSNFMVEELCEKNPLIEELRDAIPDTVDEEEEEAEVDDEDEDEDEDEGGGGGDDDDDDEEEEIVMQEDAAAAGPAMPHGPAISQGPTYHPLLQPLSKVNLPVVSIAQHHHIIHIVDVTPSRCPTRHATNLLSNSCTDSSHHYHTSRHRHRSQACKLHIPSSQKGSIYWQPYVHMHSCTVGTFSSYTMFEELGYVQMSHHFIHVHDVYSKDLCVDPLEEPHGQCMLHPQEDHGCLLLHIKTRVIDNEGFSRASVRMETTTYTSTECSRWGNTNIAHFRHSHAHDHTLHMTLQKDYPAGDPHDPYCNFLTPRDPPHGLPCSPFST